MDPRKRLLYADEAAMLVGKAPATIRDWVRKQLLTPYAVGRNGAHLYLEADVLFAERDVRMRHRCRTQRMRAK